jgi:uncharacterized protein
VFREGKILISSAILAELYEVLGRKRFRRYVNEEDARLFLAALAREGHWIDVDVQIKASRDPLDDKFLELAVAGRATQIVTGDTDLLVLNPFQGVQILPPHAFLRLFSSPSP